MSVLLIFAILLGFVMPFNAAAAEEAAENDEIYAILYYVDSNKRVSSGESINNTQNIELVFQKGNTLDSSKTLVKDKSGNEGIFKNTIAL